MSGLKEKLGIKAAVILLFSVFILLGLNMTQAYGQPLDSPLYNHTKSKAVNSMSGSDANKQFVPKSTVVTSADTCYTNCQSCFSLCQKSYGNCCPVQCLPVVSSAGELVYILILTGGACWAILRKKRS
jgi:hypothetical protein